SLTMVKPGTERPRGQQGGGGGGRRGQPGGEGQEPRERRGGPGRGGPRREPAPPSQLTGQPVGGPPVTATGGEREPAGRRFEPRAGGGLPVGCPGRGGPRQCGAPGQVRAE